MNRVMDSDIAPKSEMCMVHRLDAGRGTYSLFERHRRRKVIMFHSGVKERK